MQLSIFKKKETDANTLVWSTKYSKAKMTQNKGSQ
jgi:hypothetical protein